MRARKSVFEELFSRASSLCGVHETLKVAARQKNCPNHPSVAISAAFLPYIDTIIMQLGKRFPPTMPIAALQPLKALSILENYIHSATNPASKVVQIRAALVPVPSPDKWGGLRQEGHPA